MKNQFDELTKAAANSLTRRGSLKQFGSALGLALMGSLGFGRRAQGASPYYNVKGAKYCTDDSQCPGYQRCDFSGPLYQGVLGICAKTGAECYTNDDCAGRTDFKTICTGSVCTDPCTLDVLIACATQGLNPCSPGSAACGPLIEVCTPSVIAACAASGLGPCVSGSTACGAPLDPCTPARALECLEAGLASCAAGSAACGEPLDPCTDAVKAQCAAAGLTPCTPGSATCGPRIPGNCATNSDCLNPIQNTCSGGVCIDPCTPDVKIACALKPGDWLSCSPGSVACNDPCNAAALDLCAQYGLPPCVVGSGYATCGEEGL